MADPTNNFADFFNMDKPAHQEMMGKFKPTIREVIVSLIDLVAQNPGFYKDENLRVIALTGIMYATQELVALRNQNLRPDDVDMGMSAFMMMLSDMLRMTYNEYAGETEKEKFPLGDFNDEDEDED